MNASLISLELAVVGLGLAFLLLDLWTPAPLKRQLGYAAAVAVAILFCFSFLADASYVRFAFREMYVFDPLALFFKRFFLLAGVLVLLLQVAFADRIATGISEYYSLTLFALAGMMFTASATNFAVMFVALEVVTITFYVLTSFQRNDLRSLEAGVKYLIMGGLSSAFMVFGIAFIYGSAGTLAFVEILQQSANLAGNSLFLIGLLFVLVGLSFKIAAFPYQMWAPDVYQGAPAPSTAFLAVGSKAAGFVLLLRIIYGVAPNVFHEWTAVLLTMAALSILYGNLCAIAQTSLKRIFGYSSIAHAGYLLLGLAALNASGASAVLYYLSGYLFTVLAAFGVLVVALRSVEGDDLDSLAGLGQRSPAAGRCAHPFDGFAGRHPAAGRVRRQVSPLQGRAGRRCPPARLLRRRGGGDNRRRNQHLVLLRGDPEPLLVAASGRNVTHRGAGANEAGAVGLHGRHARARHFSRRSTGLGQRSSGPANATSLRACLKIPWTPRNFQTGSKACRLFAGRCPSQAWRPRK